MRYFQGRQLFARIGKRTLVIGDVPWVNQILGNYVSKLFSLSYGIASLEVHGANPESDLLHDFGHRVVRGTLMFLGVPDGRRSYRLKMSHPEFWISPKFGISFFGRLSFHLTVYGLTNYLVSIFSSSDRLPSSETTVHRLPIKFFLPYNLFLKKRIFKEKLSSQPKSNPYVL